MNKVRKIFIIIMLLSICMSTNVFAFGTIKGEADAFINDGGTSSITTIDDTDIKDISNTIYNIGFGIGLIVVFVVGMILGIKFIATGVEEKAEVKEALLPYVISSIVFFGAFGIWKLVVTVLGDIV